MKRRKPMGKRIWTSELPPFAMLYEALLLMDSPPRILFFFLIHPLALLSNRVSCYSILNSRGT